MPLLGVVTSHDETGAPADAAESHSEDERKVNVDEEEGADTKEPSRS